MKKLEPCHATCRGNALVGFIVGLAVVLYLLVRLYNYLSWLFGPWFSWWTHLTLGVVALVLVVGVIDALIRWVAGLRWFRRRASVPTPTPEAAQLTVNAAATTAPIQQAAAPQPAPLPAVPPPAAPVPPRRWRTAEDLNIYDE